MDLFNYGAVNNGAVNNDIISLFKDHAPIISNALSTEQSGQTDPFTRAFGAGASVTRTNDPNNMFNVVDVDGRTWGYDAASGNFVIQRPPTKYGNPSTDTTTQDAPPIPASALGLSGYSAQDISYALPYLGYQAGATVDPWAAYPIKTGQYTSMDASIADLKGAAKDIISYDNKPSGNILDDWFGLDPNGGGIASFARDTLPGNTGDDLLGLDPSGGGAITAANTIAPLVAAAFGAYYGLGAMGAAGEAGAGTAAAGSFIPSEATAGMLGLGAPASTALGLSAGGVGAGLTSAELAALYAGGIGAGTTAMGALAGTGGGIMTAAGGAAYDAAMAAGLGQDAAMQAAMAAGGDVGAGGGWLSTAKDAYDIYSQANKLSSAYKMLTGGGAAPGVGGNTGGGMATETGTDWGSMFGNLIGGAGSALSSEALGNQSMDYAKQLAEKVKFTPYAISSDIGRTYQDPATGEMISKLDPRFAAQQQAMLGAVGTNLAAAQADPQLAAQDAYSKMRMLSAFPEEQQRLAMENRLLQQGMLGSTGGANQTRAMQEAMNTNNVNQQLQSIGLGQTLANNAMTRAGQAWTGAMAPTTAMQNQLNQTGQFGSNAMQGQVAGANLMNNAFLNLQDSRAKTAQGLFGSPTFSSYGQQQTGTTGAGVGTTGSGLVNQGVNWGVNQIGNWLGGNTATSQPAYGMDQYSSLLEQQDGFNWSGVGGVSAGSAQDMMLNDQWDWSW